METNLKQRLIGAIVLTLFAAIFIPLFLSDAPVTLVMPEENQPVSEVEPQTSLVPVTEINEVIEQPITESIETVTEVSTIEEPLEQTQAESAEVKSTPQADNQSSEQSPAEQMQSVESVSITTSPVKTPTEQELMGISKGWVVQLGSFESEENAKKLNQKLLDKQFKSFIDPLKNTANTKTTYRVRVGPPQADKAKAEALKKRLNELVKIQGIVIEYP